MRAHTHTHSLKERKFGMQTLKSLKFTIILDPCTFFILSEFSILCLPLVIVRFVVFPSQLTIQKKNNNNHLCHCLCFFTALSFLSPVQLGSDPTCPLNPNANPTLSILDLSI